ncbi:MAG: hypothetical protein ACRDQB_04220 [Thermocrispum sp.]
MRLQPDDEVYRVNAVWLGPKGLTLPWTARYSAYGIWLMLFVSVLLVEAALPMRVSLPPVWEIVLTILATYAVMGLVDHDRPVASVWQLVRNETTAPRSKDPSRPVRLSVSRVRVRSSDVSTSPQ